MIDLIVDVHLLIWWNYFTAALGEGCTASSDCTTPDNAYCINSVCTCGPLYMGNSCTAKSELYLLNILANTHNVTFVLDWLISTHKAITISNNIVLKSHSNVENVLTSIIIQWLFEGIIKLKDILVFTKVSRFN